MPVVAVPGPSPVKPGWARRLWGYMMIHRQAMVLAVTAAVLVSVCQTMVSLIERQIVDGFDLRSLDLLGYRRQPGYVPQQAVLFTGTIRDTIAHDRPEASNDEVETAARAVGAHEFIAELPGGYFHELLERRRSLPSGQRQLIALARAESVDPVVLHSGQVAEVGSHEELRALGAWAMA